MIPGALENQITAAIAKKLNCKIIAEAANGPTLPEADPIIEKKKIIVVPDILANSGGVCISYLEWGSKIIWDIIGALMKLHLRWRKILHKDSKMHMHYLKNIKSICVKLLWF